MDPTEIMARSATASTPLPAASGVGSAGTPELSTGPSGTLPRPLPPSALLPSSVVVLIGGTSVYAYSASSSPGASVGAGPGGTARESEFPASVGFGGRGVSVVRRVMNSVTVLRIGCWTC